MLDSLSTWLIEKAFYTAPVAIIPLLTPSTRMDLIDLHRAKQSAVVENTLGGQTRLRSIGDRDLVVQLTEVSSIRLTLLPDSAVEVHHTFLAPDTVTISRLYDHNWKLLCKGRK